MRRILVAPPKLISSRARNSLLKRQSVELHSATTADEALALAAQTQPNLVVFSSRMTGLSAEVFCRAIRETPGLEETKTLMITEQLGPEIADFGGLSTDGHLVNPVDNSQLVRTIAGLLKLSMRKANRVPVDLIAQLELMGKDKSDDQVVVVSILNLSETGLRVESSLVLKEGSLGRVQFFLPGSQQRLNLYCIVRMLADEVLLHYGIELVKTTKEERAVLRDFVEAVSGQTDLQAGSGS